jgi:pimeloyl-ACP methyl ester carboxylesterase/DNA-binding CsgD family transcriptional regulator
MDQPRIEFARTTDGVRIAWTSVGSGPAFVHLPGVPFSNLEAEWRIPVLRRAFTRLGARVRLVEFDGRGTGRSQREPGPLSLDAFLRDVDAVIAATGERQVVLLGFYHSAMHAIAWAARHPERVRGVVLFGGALRGWDQMRGAGTQALLSLIERDWDTFAESVTHAWLGWPDDAEGRLAADWFRTSTSPAFARDALEAAAQTDVTAEAGLVGCPVLVLHREHAPVIPLEVSESLVAAIPGARLELLPGSSASLFFEATDDVVDRLAAFTLDPSGDSDRAATRRPPATTRGGGRLSPREQEVLRLVAGGETNGQIAATLGVSINTIERHVSNLYRKLQVRGRAEATAWAVRHGLV